MKKTKLNNFKESIYTEKLSNGLEVYILPLKNKSTFTAMLTVKYGGRDINFKVNNKNHSTPTGIAHFLEHKMFERKPSPFDFYDKYGLDVNAQTSDDSTIYYFSGTKCFNKSLIYLLNWISSLSITESDVKKEQGIILEEANMYKDNPDSRLYKEIKSNLYKIDPKQNEVIGTDDDIVAITKKDLDLCYNTFYNPSNMFLTIVGDINPKKVIEIVKKESKKLKNNTDKVNRLYGKESDTVKTKSKTIKMNIGIPKVATAFKMSKNIFKKLNLTEFELIAYINILMNIGLGMSSDIRSKWLKENLFTSSYFNISTIDSHLAIEFYANSLYPEKLEKELKKYLKDIKISKESFEREKKTWIASQIRMMDNPISMAYSIIENVLDYDSVMPDLINAIKNLKFEVLKQVKELCNYENSVTVKILPKK